MQKKQQFRTYSNANDFLAETQSALAADEVSNGLMLGVCLRLQQFPERAPTGLFLATVHEAAQLVAAAMMTPPHLLIVQSEVAEPTTAFEQIATQLRQWPVPPRGVNGRKEFSLLFAQVWQRLSGQTYRVGTEERVFKLTSVLTGLETVGKMRLATLDDLALVVQWEREFVLEALPDHAGNAIAEDVERIQWLLQQGNRFFWEVDGNVVSMAGKARPTAHGCTVGPVYTPPALRGKGYASGLVAHLSQHLLASGYQFTTLFTDLANPTSNSIYQKIGYRPVCDFTEYLFERVESISLE